jgi:hypothetical protein
MTDFKIVEAATSCAVLALRERSLGECQTDLCIDKAVARVHELRGNKFKFDPLDVEMCVHVKELLFDHNVMPRISHLHRRIV